MNEVTAQKVASMQRCVARARETRAAAGENFSTNYNLQDASVLNIVRACETAIDLANMVVRKRQLGIPSQSREAFHLLERDGLIDNKTADSLGAMVGFRNIAVHQYDKLDLTIVESVIDYKLDTLLGFGEIARRCLDE